MTWEKVKLSDVSESCLGKMLDQRKNKGTYKPYLANVNVRWGAFDLDNLQEMKFEDDEDERFGIKYGDLIICEGGEPGRCAIWKEELPNMKIQKALHRVRVNEEMDYRYVYYWFLLAGKQGALKQYYTGATIMHMPGQKLKEVVIDKPPLGVQRRIANYLESFDNLIENNQKQIKLLEEAAQRIYREWFVYLRFPGYEDVKIVGGVPEGWSKGTLGDVAENSGYNEKKEHRDKYSYYLPIDCLPKKSVAYTYINDISLAESSLVAFKPNDILFGAMRPYFHKVVIARDYGLTRSTCFVIKSKESTAWSFLTMLLFSEDTINYATRISVGTTMPYVRWKDFIQMPVLIPTEQMCIEFGKQFIPISKKIMKLAEQNIRVTQARDRLLPKLMSGELEV